MKKIQLSQQSFSGKLKDARDGVYTFVLEDTDKKKLVGSASLIAQHGTPEEPHTYFQVADKKKTSKSLHMGFLHQVLRVGFDYDGPTEIGGLVIDPEYRSHPQKLGRTLSFVRFMYLAARRPSFQDEVLAELLPPFDDNGESPLWAALGRKFTGMSYHEADVLSRKSREFITSLFPEGDIYICMLPPEARIAIGEVGPQTLPVKNMLERIGFKYRKMIDPFDGGPHFWANADKIQPVRDTKRVRLHEGKKAKGGKSVSGMLLNFSKNGIRATHTDVELFAGRVPEFQVEHKVKEVLGIEPGSETYFLEMT